MSKSARNRARREEKVRRRERTRSRHAGRGTFPGLPPGVELDGDPVVYASADFHQDADGAWCVAVVPTGLGTMAQGALVDAPEDLEPWHGHAPTVGDVWRLAQDKVEELSDHLRAPVATVHSLNGSTTEWAVLASRERLAEDLGPSTRAGYFTPE